MKTSASRISRRNFLAAVSTATVAGAAAVVAGKPQGMPKKVAALTTGRGYQLTDHVRKYYETTKV